MNTELAFLYYSVASLSAIAYVLAIAGRRRPIATYSNLAFAYAFILAIWPGFSVAEGSAQRDIAQNYYRGFDQDLYWLYLTFAVLAPFSLYLGQACGHDRHLKTTPRKGYDRRTIALLWATVVYGIAYLVWLPELPLTLLIMSGDLSGAEIARLSVTHNLSQNESLPFVFRYWRSILQSGLVAFFIYYVSTRGGRTIPQKLLLITLFAFTSYCLLFTLEKEPFFSFLVALFVARFLRDHINLGQSTIFQVLRPKRLAMAIAIAATTVYVYGLFTGAPLDAISGLAGRLTGQTASDYLQIESVRTGGFLGWQGVPMGFLGRLLDVELIDPSKLAIVTLYPELAALHGTGAAGGMSLAQLYWILGWWCVPVFSLAVFGIGLADRLTINTITHPTNRAMVHINIAYYAAFCASFALAITSSVFVVYGIPFLLSPSALIFLLPYLALARVSLAVSQTSSQAYPAGRTLRETGRRELMR